LQLKLRYPALDDLKSCVNWKLTDCEYDDKKSEILCLVGFFIVDHICIPRYTSNDEKGVGAESALGKTGQDINSS
jgi:hypothetical protein